MASNLRDDRLAQAPYSVYRVPKHIVDALSVIIITPTQVVEGVQDALVFSIVCSIHGSIEVLLHTWVSVIRRNPDSPKL